MAKVVFYSQTGQTRKFVNKVDEYEKLEITPERFAVDVGEPFILVIPSYESNVLPIVIDTACLFLETGDNVSNCKGLYGGGNRNFAQLFCITAKELSEEYDLPILHAFEFQGSKSDVEELKRGLDKIGS